MDGAGAPPGPSGLVGRAADVARVLSVVAGAPGEGTALLLTGDAGVGKTALLDVATRTARASGVHVLRAAGVVAEADVDFAGLNQLLMPVLDHLTALSDVHRTALAGRLGLGAGSTADDRLVLSTAALELLRQVAADAPVLVVVDDVQWWDRASADVLAFVARRLLGTRVGLLAAARPGGPSVAALAGLPAHDVQPLPDGPAEELLRYRFPSLAPRVRQRVVSTAQGNPLALLELPDALTPLQRRDLQSLPPVLPSSSTLLGVYAARIGDLPGPSRRLLLLTVLEGTGDARVLRAASPEEDWPDALGPAEEAQLLRLDPGAQRVSLRHPLIGSAVIGLASGRARRQAHRTLAEVLPDQPDRRAWHLAEATVGEAGDVADLLDQTAQRAIRTGHPGRAVDALLRAADLSRTGAARARRLAEAAYVGADIAGELRNVPRLLVRARRADPGSSGSVQSAVAAAHHLLHDDGDVDSAHRVLARTVDTALRAGGGAAPLDEALHTLLLTGHFSGRREPWRPVQSAVDQLAPFVHPAVTVSLRTLGDPARATADDLRRLDDLIAGIDGEPDPACVVRTGIAAFYLDRLDDCREALWRVVWDGREGGAVASAVNALMMLCHDAFGAGRTDEARRTAAEGVELGGTLGYRLLTVPGTYCLALIGAVGGDQATARQLAGDMVAWAAPRGAAVVEHFAGRVRALAALADGDFEEAYRQTTSITPAGTFASHVPVALWTALDLVEAAVRTGRHQAADAHVRAMQDLEVFGSRPRLRLLAAGSAALAAPDDRASALFQGALATAGADSHPFEHARVRLSYGQHLRRIRATGAAQAELAAAREAFARLGAAPWVARADHELRATGTYRSPAGLRDPVDLTPQEQEIALLAASGLTNKQIGARLYLSPRTVGAHLYRVFPKLGVTSRAALRDALDRVTVRS